MEDFSVLIIPLLFISGLIIEHFIKRNEAREILAGSYKTQKADEKREVIEQLFVESGLFVGKTMKNPDNGVEFCIYSVELALHIVGLWIGLKLDKMEQADDRVQFLESFELKLYIIAVMCYLNPMLKEFFEQKELDEEAVRKIVFARAKQVGKDVDFQQRGFNFMNLCFNEIKKEYNNCLYAGNIDELPVELAGNPFDMMLLPMAYKSGIVDKFMKKLEEEF